MMLYKTWKEDTWAPRQCPLNVNRSNKRKWKKGKKTKDISQKLWQTQSMQMIKCFLRIYLLKLNPCLQQATGGIGHDVNANKKEFMCFKQEGDISTLSGQTTKISRQVHIPWQQYLIYWKWCQQMYSNGVECYWKVINHILFTQPLCSGRIRHKVNF